jgi:threonine dehydratase
MADAFRSGIVATNAAADTIADGVAVRIPIAEAVQDMRGIVDEVWAVSDDEIEVAMQLAYQHAGVLLEPAGAVGLAGVYARRHQLQGQQVATLLCGSNVTQTQIDRHILKVNA